MYLSEDAYLKYLDISSFFLETVFVGKREI